MTCQTGLSLWVGALQKIARRLFTMASTSIGHPKHGSMAWCQPVGQTYPPTGSRRRPTIPAGRPHDGHEQDLSSAQGSSVDVPSTEKGRQTSDRKAGHSSISKRAMTLLALP